MERQKSIIHLRDVWKTYRVGEVDVNALRGVSLEVRRGEFAAIVGPSGSGKSTMMNLVGCLDLPTSGQVFLDGNDITRFSESKLAGTRGRKIGFVFQQFNLIPTLTALENVMLPLEFQNVDSSSARERASEVLNLVGLQDRMKHLPSQLSGGEMQRVAIARSLAPDPEIILADEPTGNLDSRTGEFIMGFLKKIHKDDGKTIIIVTHDLQLASYAERIINLKDGKIEKIETGRRSGK
jgi:putative ABC transport system ATP-binding protein